MKILLKDRFEFRQKFAIKKCDTFTTPCTRLHKIDRTAYSPTM